MIPLSIILFDRGANGVPTTSNPVNLAGRVESYEDTVSDRYGFKTARGAWTPTWAEIEEWARYDHLMRPMVAYTPDARIAWEGFLAEIEISIGTKKIAFSLKDMANRLVVRYSEPGGKQGDSATYSNAASQALFGIKDRVINASVAASAAASNQAQTILNFIAFPRSKQPSSAGTPRGELSISLTFWGKYALLDWLLTSNTSTATSATSIQIASLLTAYVAINPFFSASAANITATGVADTEYIEPDTTYREKIERLLARGNSAQQPLAWGFYDDDVFVVTPRASATPATITYYESEASGQIRDQWQNVLDVWDVRPNAMAQIVDLIDAPTPGSVETPFRKYVARVTRSVRGDDVTVTLEPDDTESLEDLLTSPAGAGPAGTSERQAAFERKVTAPARSVFANTDNNTRFDRAIGVWKPAAGGTGKANTGTIDTGGRDITYPPGTGTYTGVTGSGTTGALAKWADGSGGTLGNAVAGTDYSAPGHTHVAADITSGVFATGRLGTGTANNTKYLRGDGTWQPLDVTAVGAGTVGGTGTAGRIAQWATGGADLQDSTLIKTGAGLLTLSAAGAATLTIDASIRLTGSGASSGDALIYNGTAFAPTALTPAAIGAAPSDAKYIVQQASAGLSAEQALGSLASGLLKNTTTTGVLSIAVAGTDYAAAAHTHTTTDVTNFAEAVDDRVAALLVAGSGIGLSYNDAGNVLTIANTGGTVGGTGTAGRVPQWATGGANLQDSTLIKTGAGLLTLNATTTEQVQIASGGTLDLNNNVMVFPVPGSVPTGVGVNKNLVFWNSTNGVSPAANLYWDSNNGRLGINSATPAYRLELGFDSAAKPSTNTWTVVSDVRTKYPGSIVPFRDGLAALLQLRPVRFTYNGAAGTPKGGRGVGLIAQEVARVIPRWIRRSRGKLRPHDLRETELLSVNSGDFDLMVINALREIADRLTALEQ